MSTKKKSPFPSAPPVDPRLSFQDQILLIKHNVLLIQAACAGAESVGDSPDLMDAITETIEDVLDELEPLEQVPAALANWHVPESDRARQDFYRLRRLQLQRRAKGRTK